MSKPKKVGLRVLFLLVLCAGTLVLGDEYRISGELECGLLGPGSMAVVDHAIIPAQAVVTVAPGTHFVFQGFYEIKVEGRLVAMGQKNKLIVFEPDSGREWMGITFQSPGDSSILAYCHVRGASTGLHISGVSPWIHHCRFEQNRYAIQCWNHAKPLIHNNDFVGNEDALNNYNSKPYLYNNLFAYNHKWGIWSVGEHRAVYSHNAFWKNGQGRRAVFANQEWVPMDVLKVWQELEVNPLFVDESRAALQPNSPLIHAGTQELTNEHNWNVVLADAPSIGTENIVGSLAKQRIGTAPKIFMTGLNQNLPNPFTPATTIQYIVGGKQGETMPIPVTLSIHNLNGQLITALVSKRLEPGPYKAKWNRRDKSQKLVSSGTYFYRLSLPGHVLVRRMTVVE